MEINDSNFVDNDHYGNGLINYDMDLLFIRFLVTMEKVHEFLQNLSTILNSIKGIVKSIE